MSFRPSSHLGYIGKRLIDENEWDQEGKDLLCESGDEANQEASFAGHNNNNNQDNPQSNPHTTHDVFNALAFTELRGKKIKDWQPMTINIFP